MYGLFSHKKTFEELVTISFLEAYHNRFFYSNAPLHEQFLAHMIEELKYPTLQPPIINLALA